MRCTTNPRSHPLVGLCCSTTLAQQHRLPCRDSASASSSRNPVKSASRQREKTHLSLSSKCCWRRSLLLLLLLLLLLFGLAVRLVVVAVVGLCGWCGCSWEVGGVWDCDSKRASRVRTRVPGRATCSILPAVVFWDAVGTRPLEGVVISSLQWGKCMSAGAGSGWGQVSLWLWLWLC